MSTRTGNLLERTICLKLILNKMILKNFVPQALPLENGTEQTKQLFMEILKLILLYTFFKRKTVKIVKKQK